MALLVTTRWAETAPADDAQDLQDEAEVDDLEARMQALRDGHRSGVAAQAQAQAQAQAALASAPPLGFGEAELDGMDAQFA